MKTVQKGSEILRVSNEDADFRVNNGWTLVAKKLWKEQVRGPVKKAPVKVEKNEKIRIQNT
jgi:hypothetical protein